MKNIISVIYTPDGEDELIYINGQIYNYYSGGARTYDWINIVNFNCPATVESFDLGFDTYSEYLGEWPRELDSIIKNNYWK